MNEVELELLRVILLAPRKASRMHLYGVKTTIQRLTFDGSLESPHFLPGGLSGISSPDHKWCRGGLEDRVVGHLDRELVSP